MSLPATWSLFIIEGRIGDSQKLKGLHLFDILYMAANEISRARGNTILILCSEVIYLFTLIYGIL
jgi:hypothetical protein